MTPRFWEVSGRAISLLPRRASLLTWLRHFLLQPSSCVRLSAVLLFLDVAQRQQAARLGWESTWGFPGPPIVVPGTAGHAVIGCSTGLLGDCRPRRLRPAGLGTLRLACASLFPLLLRCLTKTRTSRSPHQLECACSQAFQHAWFSLPPTGVPAQAPVICPSPLPDPETPARLFVPTPSFCPHSPVLGFLPALVTVLSDPIPCLMSGHLSLSLGPELCEARTPLSFPWNSRGPQRSVARGEHSANSY